MKLDAVNGNLLTLSLPSQEEQKLAKVQASMDQEADEGCDKEVEVGAGKKKGARKKRSLNWEEAERCLLLEVIKPKVDYVENRSVDAKSIKAKRLAWMQITKQFNALNFRHRSLEQIQVQWRSMKNTAKREHQQKFPKSEPVEGMEMVEFMEELQKEPITVRSQTRGGGIVIKKEILDDDEDMPLAALPTSTNNSEDTLQTTMDLPSPPLSADSQYEIVQATPTRNRKKSLQSTVNNNSAQKSQTTPTTNNTGIKQKRKRSQNSNQSDLAAIAPPLLDLNAQTPIAQLPLAALAAVTSLSSNTSTSACPLPTAADTEKYKKQIFDLMKKSRLAEMDYARREHEQKLNFEQIEHELKLNYYRQQEELKLQQLREDHEMRLRHSHAEHEARMRVYKLSVRNNNAASQSTSSSSAKVEINDCSTTLN